MLSQVSAIKFGVLSDQDILDMSVCLVDKTVQTVESGSIYDLKMGSTSTSILCETCNKNVWECPGHFGHINLNTPIILLYKPVVVMLKCFCFSCKRILCSKEALDLNGVRGYDNIVAYLIKISTCCHCGTPHPEIKFSIAENVIFAQHKFKGNKTLMEITPMFVKSVFDLVSDEDVKMLGVDVTMFHPRNLVLTKFPVIPTTCRPRMMTPDNISDDDLSIILVDIVKNNNYLKTEDKTSEKYIKALANIKFRTLTYCDNTRGKAVHNTNHKAMTGIKERISRKGGLIRKNLMGKRCDYTGRTVIGPDPTLKMNEVGVPHEMADALTVPEYVNSFNIERLTKIVNANMATIICHPNGVKKNVSTALMGKCIHLQHGDVVTKNGKSHVVTNCKIPIEPGDKIQRKGKTIVAQREEKSPIELKIGDKVERFLQDGDVVLLNRQPTLHKNSMQGMKVRRQPGKTLRINLSQTKGYNADFDGDEMNLFIPQTMEAMVELSELSLSTKMMLSCQTNKPVVVIVQDSLLGAYLMTKDIKQMTRADFTHCLFKTNCFDKYNYIERLETIRRIRNEPDQYTTPALFGFLFPSDFFVSYDEITIEYGVIVKGVLDKTTLGGTKKSLNRILCLEYGENVAADFINNIQFITNAWLEFNSFSVGIEDCFINPEHCDEIKNIVYKSFMEAEQMISTTDNPDIRESRIACSLNKAKDVGLKLAKDTLKPDNNFISTVTAGSKGDYFNIAQIMGLLGQQNISGKRPRATMDSNRRTLNHYPRIIPDAKRKYESRGFVASSFINGLNPKEMYFHAMSGREGMINTSLGTATSGYIQRRTVKMNEDLKIAYDGTVRDAKQNIYQFAFGGHGYDPSKITVTGGQVFPVDVKRLSVRLNSRSSYTPEHLTEMEIDTILTQAVIPPPVPAIISEEIASKQRNQLRTLLNDATIAYDMKEDFSKTIINKYNVTKITPGECVGIIGAQSIGEKQTQMTLNTFHTAGKLQQTGVGRFQELLNTTKALKVKTCTLYFKERFASALDLRHAIGSSIVHLTLEQVVKSQNEISCESNHYIYFRFYLDLKIIFKYKLTPIDITNALKKTFDDCRCIPEAFSIVVGIEKISDPINKEVYVTTLLAALNKTTICGIEGIHEMYLNYANDEWFVITNGSNLMKLLAHPMIDNKRIYCNNLWEVYECLGITAMRKMLFKDIKENVEGVNDFHIQLLVDKMTFKGKPTPITRYSMRKNDVGPLSKATFEESIDTIQTAAMKTEVETNCGVSASIISGNQPKIGTGYMRILIDIEKLDVEDNTITTNNPDEDEIAAYENLNYEEDFEDGDDFEDGIDITPQETHDDSSSDDENYYVPKLKLW